MSLLGEIHVLDFLQKVNGEVTGRQISDGKDRLYKARYEWKEVDSGLIFVSRNGSSKGALIPAVIPLDESLTAFFGLYSGDGAKGSESNSQNGILRTSISFSQREPNLVKFAVYQFRRIFPEARFTFSLGEDSAYFMAGEGLKQLIEFHKGNIPTRLSLSTLVSSLRRADVVYLGERRPLQIKPDEDLAFFYQFKKDMEEILTQQKTKEIERAGIFLNKEDKITASMRRPFKKGARAPGGTSRSDETHVGNVSGLGELFLKMLHEIEETILDDRQISSQGLIRWMNMPSQTGEELDVKDFFENHAYGLLNGQRPVSIVSDTGSGYLLGLRKASKVVRVTKRIRLTPLWCYTSGLYLAEGVGHDKMFKMFDKPISGHSLGFTSSDNTSLELIIRSLQSLFEKSICVETWKVKVGSQYFQELVVIGLKNSVPMLRGGNSGDGKLRTMEISLAIKDWALSIAPVMRQYQDKYSHVEPTGAGVPRIDISASSALCKWYFPLVMFAVFGDLVSNPTNEFIHD